MTGASGKPTSVVSSFSFFLLSLFFFFIPQVLEPPPPPGPAHLYRFCGMVCYYGQHYVALSARRLAAGQAGRGEWVCFDDEKVKVLASWRDVQVYCLKVKRGRIRGRRLAPRGGQTKNKKPKRSL